MNEASDTVRVRLRGDLNVARMAALWKRFRPVLERSQNLVLDLGEVESVDVSGMQLLLLAEREMQQFGGALRLQEATPHVRSSLAFFSLDRLLDGEEA